MFSVKKAKALQREVVALREENANNKGLFDEIIRWYEDVMEHLTHITASNAQLEKETEQIKEQIQHIQEMSGGGADAAGEIHNALVSLNNDIGTFAVNHSVFLKQAAGQNEKITELMEKNRQVAAEVKAISEAPAAFREQQETLSQSLEGMREFSGNISVLALNAAIEAGRMGESGSGFITVAEEIRSYSEQYEREIGELSEKLTQSGSKIAALEEQVQKLNALLKESNAVTGKLYQDSATHLTAYKGGQRDLRSLLPESMIGRADALRQMETGNRKTEEEMLGKVEDIRKGLAEQKDSVDELERIYKWLRQSAGMGWGD